MHTISLRPDIPNQTTKRCSIFEQESKKWHLGISNEDVSGGVGTARGFLFHTPLENVRITVEELAALIAGLESAYTELATAIFQEAPKALASTIFENVENFMSSIPTGFFETKPTDFPSAHESDSKPVPILCSPAREKCLLWTGRFWGEAEAPADIETYTFIGNSFGWDVAYKQDGDEEYACAALELCFMVASLFTALVYFDTQAKLYAANLYSVQ
jgi:hypothetical protein